MKAKAHRCSIHQSSNLASIVVIDDDTDNWNAVIYTCEWSGLDSLNFSFAPSNLRSRVGLGRRGNVLLDDDRPPGWMGARFSKYGNVGHAQVAVDNFALYM